MDTLLFIGGHELFNVPSIKTIHYLAQSQPYPSTTLVNVFSDSYFPFTNYRLQL